VTLDPTSEVLLRAWLDASARTGVLLGAAWALDRLLRTRADPGSRMWLYAPVWLSLLVPTRPGQPVAMPPVSRVLMGSPAPLAEPAATEPVPWLAILWLAGVLVLATSAFARQLRFRRQLRESVADPALAAQLEGVTVPVRVHPRLGPLVFGVLRPALVLPAPMARLPLSQEARCAVAHEIAHLHERHLPLSAALQLGCVALWPLLPLWLASRRLHALVEQAADAGALARLSVSPALYGRVLIGLDHRPTPGGFAMAAYPDIRERIEAIARPARWPRALSLPLVLALSALALGLASQGLASDAPAPRAADQAHSLEIELGHSVLLTLPRDPLSSTVDDPEVAAVEALGDPRRLHVRATGLGHTRLTMTFAGKPLSYEVNVVPARPHPEDADLLRVSLGEPLLLELGAAPVSYASSDRSVLEVRPGKDEGELELVGVRAGQTDLVVLQTAKGKSPLMWRVAVE
jgi:bla regulator protein BlaR1